MKRCSKCKQTLPLADFPKSKAEKDGLFSYCRPCNKARRKPPAPLTPEEADRRRKMARDWHKANREKVAARKKRERGNNAYRIREYQRGYQAKKRARKQHAMPAWADQALIRRFYAEAELMTQLTGIKHEVDHIIPLNGKGVCGLHIPANLRVVTREFNGKKGNKLTLI